MVELTIRGDGLRELLEVLNALARPGGTEMPVTTEEQAPVSGADGLAREREYELARAQMKSVEAGIENIMSFSVGGKTGLEGKEE